MLMVNKQSFACAKCKIELDKAHLEGMKAKLRDAQSNQINEVLSNLEKLEGELRTMSLRHEGSEFNDQKIDKLDTASDLINDAKDLIKMATSLTGKQSSASASTAGSVAAEAQA